MKQMYFSISILFILISSCGGGNRFSAIEREEEPTIYTAQASDKIMNRAILTAKQTLKAFDTALLSQNPLYSDFSLKPRFDAEGGGEHLWINNITIRNGNYFGVVNSAPESTTAVKLGDSIKINSETITDWMYLEDGVLRGGYTIRAIRDQMTMKEKESFDSEIGFVITE